MNGRKIVKNANIKKSFVLPDGTKISAQATAPGTKNYKIKVDKKWGVIKPGDAMDLSIGEKGDVKILKVIKKR